MRAPLTFVRAHHLIVVDEGAAEAEANRARHVVDDDAGPQVADAEVALVAEGWVVERGVVPVRVGPTSAADALEQDEAVLPRPGALPPEETRL